MKRLNRIKVNNSLISAMASLINCAYVREGKMYRIVELGNKTSKVTKQKHRIMYMWQATEYAGRKESLGKIFHM